MFAQRRARVLRPLLAVLGLWCAATAAASGVPPTVPADSVVQVVDPFEEAASYMPEPTVEVETLSVSADTMVVSEVAATISTVKPAIDYDRWEARDTEFNPDPTRAVWMAALCPGLGQLYNRRYWKLPIVVGAYLGLGYATSWNNSMLRDYTRAYRDLTDNDPSTKSYMNFFPPTTDESSLDQTWLTSIMRARKDFYRRNRDLCIISMVGVYLLAIVDAYVDASLSHFDISPDLSIDWTPRVFKDSRDTPPAIGLAWALNF